MDDLKAQHDELMKSLPNGADHAGQDCPWCLLEKANVEPEGGEMSKTYTEEEFNVAMAEALAPVQAELDGIKATQSEQDVQSRINQAVASVEATKTELQNALDVAQAEVESVKAERDAIVSWLESEATAAEQAAEFAARKDERLERVKTVASYKEEYLDANADRWAAMDDDSFDALIGDIAAKTSGAESTEQPNPLAATAMQASREGEKKVSRLREVMHMQFDGLDPRTISSGGV